MVYQEVLVLLFASFTVSQSKLVGEPHLLTQFSSFMETHQKNYVNEEEKALRFQVFQDNLKHIEQLNVNASCGVEYAVNRFADLTRAEFSAKYLGLLASRQTVKASASSTKPAKLLSTEIPTEFDWRKIVTAYPPTPDQDNIVDCSGNDRCAAGYLYKSLDYMNNTGLVLESQYPYVAQNQSCTYKPGDSRPTIKIKNYYSTPGEPDIQAALPNSPVAVAVNSRALQFYMKGILNPNEQQCPKNSVDHAVIAIGVGTDVNCKIDYWIMRNSWGADWGENGHFRIARGVKACALGTDSNYGVEFDTAQVSKLKEAKKTKKQRSKL